MFVSDHPPPLSARRLCGIRHSRRRGGRGHRVRCAPAHFRVFRAFCSCCCAHPGLWTPTPSSHMHSQLQSRQGFTLRNHVKRSVHWAPETALPAVSVCITIHNRILDSAHHQMTFLCRCGRRVSATVQSIVAWSSSNCRPEIRRSPSGLTFVIWRTVFSLVLMSNLGDHLSHSVLP